MTARFPMRRSRAMRLLWPLVRGEVAAEVVDGVIRVRLGGLGRAEIDVANVARLSRMTWPWWGGLGVRIGRQMVAFATAPGEAVLIELVERIAVRIPLAWRTARIALTPVDAEAFMAAVAEAAREARATEKVPSSPVVG